MDGCGRLTLGVRMAKDKLTDKDAFDAVLKRMIETPPMPLKSVVGKGKRPETGQPKPPKMKRAD